MCVWCLLAVFVVGNKKIRKSADTKKLKKNSEGKGEGHGKKSRISK